MVVLELVTLIVTTPLMAFCAGSDLGIAAMSKNRNTAASFRIVTSGKKAGRRRAVIGSTNYLYEKSGMEYLLSFSEAWVIDVHHFGSPRFGAPFQRS